MAAAPACLVSTVHNASAQISSHATATARARPMALVLATLDLVVLIARATRQPHGTAAASFILPLLLSCHLIVLADIVSLSATTVAHARRTVPAFAPTVARMRTAARRLATLSLHSPHATTTVPVSMVNVCAMPGLEARFVNAATRPRAVDTALVARMALVNGVLSSNLCLCAAPDDRNT